jgi:hypothetical protein
MAENDATQASFDELMSYVDENLKID